MDCNHFVKNSRFAAKLNFLRDKKIKYMLAAFSIMAVFPAFAGNSACYAETLKAEIPEVSEEILSGQNPLSLKNGIELYIDDRFAVRMENTEKLSEILSDILNEYSESDTDIKNPEFLNKIETGHGLFPSESFMDFRKAEEILKGEKKICGFYTAQKDDTIDTIAEKFDMTPQLLINLNPIISDEILEGMELKIIEKVPVLSVIYTKTLTETYETDFETITEYDNTLPENFSEIISFGQKGEKINVFEVRFINGTEAARRITASKMLKQPVSEITLKGTKKPILHQNSSSVPTASQGNTSINSTGRFIWPVAGGYISDTFGGYRNHKGLDIAAPYGTKIYASDSGRVIKAGWNNGGYGNYVMIDHGGGYVTLYAHMSRISAVQGQTVQKGEVIGYVGSTGNSTGNHLHFEIRVNGVCVNPANYIGKNNSYNPVSPPQSVPPTTTPPPTTSPTPPPTTTTPPVTTSPTPPPTTTTPPVTTSPTSPPTTTTPPSTTSPTSPPSETSPPDTIVTTTPIESTEISNDIQ